MALNSCFGWNVLKWSFILAESTSFSNQWPTFPNFKGGHMLHLMYPCFQFFTSPKYLRSVATILVLWWSWVRWSTRSGHVSAANGGSCFKTLHSLQIIKKLWTCLTCISNSFIDSKVFSQDGQCFSLEKTASICTSFLDLERLLCFFPAMCLSWFTLDVECTWQTSQWKCWTSDVCLHQLQYIFPKTATGCLDTWLALLAASLCLCPSLCWLNCVAVSQSMLQIVQWSRSSLRLTLDFERDLLRA